MAQTRMIRAARRLVALESSGGGGVNESCAK